MADQSDLVPSNIDQLSDTPERELRKLIGPAMSVLEKALVSPDPKLRVETAKWILTCFPETAPKKSLDTAAPSVTNINTFSFNMEKFKHIAAGVKKLETARFEIIEERDEERLPERIPIHSERNDENERDIDETRG